MNNANLVTPTDPTLFRSKTSYLHSLIHEQKEITLIAENAGKDSSRVHKNITLKKFRQNALQNSFLCLLKNLIKWSYEVLDLDGRII